MCIARKPHNLGNILPLRLSRIWQVSSYIRSMDVCKEGDPQILFLLYYWLVNAPFPEGYLSVEILPELYKYIFQFIVLFSTLLQSYQP